MKRAIENSAFRIEPAIINLHLVASLDCRLRAVGQRRKAHKDPGIVLRSGKSPFHPKGEILKDCVEVPEKAGPAVTLDSSVRQRAKAAEACHAPAGLIEFQQPF